MSDSLQDDIDAAMKSGGWRWCPHWFGWRYNTHRRRRFCRVCAYQQRLDKETGQWVSAN